jgi:hypothetical protein
MIGSTALGDEPLAFIGNGPQGHTKTASLYPAPCLIIELLTPKGFSLCHTFYKNSNAQYTSQLSLCFYS